MTARFVEEAFPKHVLERINDSALRGHQSPRQGRIGEVCLAQDVCLGRRVALKVRPRVATARVRESDHHGVVIDHFHLMKVGNRWSTVTSSGTPIRSGFIAWEACRV
jgi:hypothetical protein